MLATVAFNATGMTSVLKGANGVADRLEKFAPDAGETRNGTGEASAGEMTRAQQPVTILKRRNRMG